MSVKKISKSVYFTDKDNNARFLFKILNYGKNTDEIKVSFSSYKDSKSVIYNDSNVISLDDSLIRKFGEISYHSDGSVLWKFPQTKSEPDTIIKNPNMVGSRRTPLKEIREWEPFFMGNIIKYDECKIGKNNNIELIKYLPNIFTGQPFEYLVHLGHMRYQNPPNKKKEEFIYRINDIGMNLDLIIWIRKSSYCGEHFQLGTIKGWNNDNRIRIIEQNIIIKDGAVQIDLKMLRNVEWNAIIVDSKMKLNLNVLKKFPPQSPVGKVYLKDNPYLFQIEKLVGYNKVFSLQPLFARCLINVKLVGILDEDSKGSFLGIGTVPRP